MFLTEYDEAKALRMERQEGFQEGFQEGYQESIMQERERIASAMIKEGGVPVSFIAKITELSEDAVRKLAQTMGRTVL